MACPDFDPRNGGTCAGIMAKKFISAAVGILQVIFWVLGLVTLIFKPSAAGVVMEKNSTTTNVIVWLILLACLVSSSVLVAGVFKQNRLFVKIYLVYVVVYTILMMIGLVVNICTQPQVLGFRGFFSTVLCILLQMSFFGIVKCYYLQTHCRRAPPPPYRSPNNV